MSAHTADIKQFFAPSQAYYEDLSLQTKQQTEQNLADTKQKIEASASGNGTVQSESSNKTTYIVLGIAAVLLLTLGILKRKKII